MGPLVAASGRTIPGLELGQAEGLAAVDPVTDERRFARVKVPPLLPRFVVMPDGERFVPLEQVIAAHLDRLFPGMVIEENYAFRVTRNADLTLEEEEADDLGAIAYNPAGIADCGNALFGDFAIVNVRTEFTRKVIIPDSNGNDTFITSPTVTGTTPRYTSGASRRLRATSASQQARRRSGVE